MADKPRILNNGKDMFWSLVPLLALCALVAIASGNCSIGASKDVADSKLPPFDVVSALNADAAQLRDRAVAGDEARVGGAAAGIQPRLLARGPPHGAAQHLHEGTGRGEEALARDLHAQPVAADVAPPVQIEIAVMGQAARRRRIGLTERHS